MASYVLSISGQFAAASEEEARAFEVSVANKAREFVGQLDGVVAADATFGFISSQDLTSPEGPVDNQVPEGTKVPTVEVTADAPAEAPAEPTDEQKAQIADLVASGSSQEEATAQVMGAAQQ